MTEKTDSSDFDAIAESVDEAIRAIIGIERFDLAIEDPSWDRIEAMRRAALKAWRDMRPEDEHSAVLRRILTRIDRTGRMDAADGEESHRRWGGRQ